VTAQVSPSGVDPNDPASESARMDADMALESIGRHVGVRTLATAESITAGRVAQLLATVPKAAEFFRGGLVPYQEPLKRELLGVTAASVYSHRAAREMAAGAARLFGASVAVATTGVAGDAPMDGVPPGTVFVGLSCDGEVSSFVHVLDGEPEDVAERAAERALAELAIALRAL
jgi:nicotinamide-nucleotide amidase